MLQLTVVCDLKLKQDIFSATSLKRKSVNYSENDVWTLDFVLELQRVGKTEKKQNGEVEKTYQNTDRLAVLKSSPALLQGEAGSEEDTEKARLGVLITNRSCSPSVGWLLSDKTLLGLFRAALSLPSRNLELRNSFTDLYRCGREMSNRTKSSSARRNTTEHGLLSTAMKPGPRLLNLISDNLNSDVKKGLWKSYEFPLFFGTT